MGSNAAGVLAFFDQFPEDFGLANSLILCEREFAAIEKVLQGVFMEYPVDDHLALRDLEIKSQVLCTVTVEFLPTPLDHAVGLRTLYGF